MSPFQERASLDHLKHQAKDLLRGLRAGDPEAQQRALDHLPRHRQDQEPKLTDAQLIVAREYGYHSWPRMKEHLELLANPVEMEPDDPPEVQMASVLLISAMKEPWSWFSLRREGVDILLTVPVHGCCHLAEWLPVHASPGSSFIPIELPLPTAELWARLLHMAGLDKPDEKEGKIRITFGHFPRMEWTFGVTLDGPDKLDFTASLDHVDATMPPAK